MSKSDSIVRIALLNSPLIALIDAADEPATRGLRWYVQFNGNRRLSSVRASQPGGGYVLLHRLLLKAAAGLVVDHIDGDVLNNCRANLRICTQAENARNSKLRSHSKSGTRNVGWKSKGGNRSAWQATVTANGTIYRKWFGTQPSGRDAAFVWAEQLRQQLHGDFAYMKTK